MDGDTSRLTARDDVTRTPTSKVLVLLFAAFLAAFMLIGTTELGAAASNALFSHPADCGEPPGS